MIHSRIEFCYGPGKDFVNISERLNLKSTLCEVKIAEATNSLTQLKRIYLSFFYRVDQDKQTFLYTALLSYNTSEGPSTGISNICSLYLKEIISSKANRKATNSEPKVEILTIL